MGLCGRQLGGLWFCSAMTVFKNSAQKEPVQRLNVLSMSWFHLCGYMTLLLVHLPAQQFKGIRSGFLAELCLHSGYFKWVSNKQYFLLSLSFCVSSIVFLCVLVIVLFFPSLLFISYAAVFSLLYAYLRIDSLMHLVQPPPKHCLIRMAGKTPVLAGSKQPFKKGKLI